MYILTIGVDVGNLKTFLMADNCVCVCVYVCVCMCVCVFVSSFTVKASYVSKISEKYLRGTDQQCYVVSIIPGASAKFLPLGI